MSTVNTKVAAQVASASSVRRMDFAEDTVTAKRQIKIHTPFVIQVMAPTKQAVRQYMEQSFKGLDKLLNGGQS